MTGPGPGVADGRRELPAGTVTFLFTDIEGSTRLLHELGAEAYADALAEHRRILRDAFHRHGGVEVDTQGDAFFVAFPTARGALDAAAEAQAALVAGPISVRMGVHTGTPHLTAEGYVGADVHRAARIAATGHGGQVLVSAATASLVETADLRDLGEHRLKDLSAPERIHQLGAVEFPPLRSLHQTNLPVPATTFLGRDRELEAIAGLLARPEVRVVTLTGPGGTGKTRLALQAAGAAAEAFPGGVWWVSLAPIRDPALVLTEAAASLGAQGDLAEHIGERRTLILFDNFEQVTDAAPDLAELLRRSPNLRLLVTSREPLRIAGEWEYAVEPLGLPEAVELFTTRALAVRQDFAANGEVREICLRLDNLPLAIELAAARVKVLSARAIFERLDQRLPMLTAGARDAPDRQRTLRATVEWSYDLLSDDERRLFARLAIFRGGWTLEAAEEIVGADLDLLGSLVDKSLVRQRDDRFRMLETIREYAADRLETSGEAGEMRRRHWEYFIALAEAAHPRIPTESAVWIPRLEAEHDNLRAAIDRLTAANETRLVARLCGALWRFWYLGDHVIEGTRQLDAALALHEMPDADRARALNGATALALERGDVEAGRRHALTAVAIHESLDDRWALANSRFLMAQVSATEGDWETGRELLEASVREFEALGDSHFTMIATRTLAWMYYELGDRTRERALTEQYYERARALGNRRVLARAQTAMGGFAMEEGRLDEALAMYRSSLLIDRDVAEQNGMRIDLYDIAELLAMAGQGQDAARLLAATDAWRERTGAALESWLERLRRETIERIRVALGSDELDGAMAEGAALSPEEAVELALSVSLVAETDRK